MTRLIIPLFVVTRLLKFFRGLHTRARAHTRTNNESSVLSLEKLNEVSSSISAVAFSYTTTKTTAAAAAAAT